MRLLSARKDKQGREWFIVTNPATGVEEPIHISLGSFNTSDGIYLHFLKTNNLLVKAAVKWGIDLGQGYEKFYQQGMRISQQIDVYVGGESGYSGRRVGLKTKDEDGYTTIVSLRDKCEEDYTKRAAALEELLIESIKIKKRGIENSQYDMLYESVKDSLPQEDLEYISNNISRLKEKKIIESAHCITLEERLNRLSQDRNKEFLEFFPKVNDNAKALFFHVVKYAELEQKDDWFVHSVDEVYNFTEKIGAENARLYLICLLLALKRDENVNEFDGLVKHDVGRLENEQWNEYFSRVFLFQSDGYPGNSSLMFAYDRLKLEDNKRKNYDLMLKKLINETGSAQLGWTMAFDAVRKHEILESLDIADKVISVYNQTKDERKALSVIYN